MVFATASIAGQSGQSFGTLLTFLELCVPWESQTHFAVVHSQTGLDSASIVRNLGCSQLHHLLLFKMTATFSFQFVLRLVVC